tara:strand:+ start:51671 stop:52165 length:495 start_codon:yes stop_codon:yes gene_type:complete
MKEAFILSPGIETIAAAVDRNTINFKKPARIEMKTFMSYFDIEFTEVEGDFLGKSNGWTRHENKEYNIEISGAYPRELRGVEYFNSVQVLRAKLDNPYNDFVSVFYLWNLLNPEGKAHFINAYADEITALKEKKQRAFKKAQAEFDIVASGEAELIKSAVGESK